MTLPEVGAYLSAAGIGLSLGTSLFYGPIQDRAETTAVAGLLPYTGARASEQRFGDVDLAYEWPRIQVNVRGPVDGLESALALAQIIYTTLGRVQAQTLGTTFYHGITCLQPPYLLRYDANRRPIVVFNVQIEKEVGA
jgi:hypothetical protein